ncbi:hypothetical protein EVAR_5389_1 [Eumeta japonica]|uniref:Mariner Mos1 transposase n=1 Tax=Eumeta variegata TaxID=151549 RepID=A0A4C1TP05_EUMVA|nr:hypothetical protein EVAR_5389_1 [Eumeta japonica]
MKEYANLKHMSPYDGSAEDLEKGKYYVVPHHGIFITGRTIFRQIIINSEDKDFQLIDWHEVQDLPLRLYKLHTVAYATKSSPFLAIRTLRQLACNGKTTYPAVAQLVGQQQQRALENRKIELRAIKQLCLKNYTTQRVNQDSQDAIGANPLPPYSTVVRWCADSERGGTSTKDNPRSGRPTTVVTEQMVKKIEDHRFTVRFIAKETKISFGSVHVILHERLWMQQVSLRWVPRMFTNARKPTGLSFYFSSFLGTVTTRSR